MLALAKDYLYSQGYFNTLACLQEPPDVEKCISNEAQDSTVKNENNCEVQMDEREKRIKDGNSKSGGAQERRIFSPSKESKLEPVDSKVLIERDFTPQMTNFLHHGAL